jgi:hypothetical protein
LTETHQKRVNTGLRSCLEHLGVAIHPGRWSLDAI